MTLVGNRAGVLGYGSLYFTLPAVEIFLLEHLLHAEDASGKIQNTAAVRKLSTILYLVQFGFITVYDKLLCIIGLPLNVKGVIIWLSLCASGVMVYFIQKRFPLLAKLF